MGSGDDKTIIADAGALAALANPPNGKACLIQYSGTRVGKRYILDAVSYTHLRAHEPLR